MLLHLFLTRHYSEVDIVFIRHTTEAQEVDEETFFRDTETGGTVVSTALEEMLRILDERYPIDDWNIYAAQASDGHNFDDDMEDCLELLNNDVLPLCQYFAYIEVAPDRLLTVDDERGVVWLPGGRQAEPELRHEARCQPRRHLSGVPRAVRLCRQRPREAV